MKTTTYLTLVLLVLICASVSYAQTATTGVVLGTVKDTSDAVVAGAEVTLTDATTNMARTQTTNDDGLFTFPGIMPGTYQLKVTAKGFKVAVVNSVVVEVNKSVRTDIALEVGE